MSTILEDYQIEVSEAQLEFQSVDYQAKMLSLETRIQLLEEENARLQESLRFFLEICCCDD